MNWSKISLSTFVKSAMMAGVSGSILIPDQGFSAPQGGVVSHGDGSISTNNKVTTVQQNSSALVVDWQSFNVAQDELVKFEHRSAKATTLNRIHDQNASQILGRVEGRGKVLLINPNGIVFGESSSVNLGSLVASTKQISDDDFMAGNIVLRDVDGEGVIVNRGTLTAATGGAVVLLGDTVVNEGVIQATKGSVVLASGESATLDFDGDGLLQFKLSGQATEGESDSAVLNAGLISAADGSVLLAADTARDVFANVVNNTGVIEAKGIDTSGGKIRLLGEGGTVHNSGKLIATSATGVGGDIDVSGDRTIIDTGALLDVSGEAGGGNIRVGGGYQGKDASINNARETLIAEAAELKADAGSGDGGRVIVWADESTSYKGSISARGGQNRGNGGFAEVSGKEGLQFSGEVDLRAASGKAGTLLIDPRDIRIVQGGKYPLSSSVLGSDNAASNARIDVDQLIALLKTANVSLQASDNIFVETAIDTTGNAGGVVSENNLALDAGTNISIDGAIQLKTGAALSLTAGGEITQSQSITASTLNIDGNATLNHAGNDFGIVTLSGSSATSLHLRDKNNLSVGALNVDNLSITTGGALTQNGAFVVANTASFDTDSATLTLANNFNTLSLKGGSAVVNDINGVVLGSTDLAGNLTVTAAGNITQSGAVEVDGATSLTATNADIALDNSGNDFFSLALNAVNAAIQDSNALTLAASTLKGTLDVTSGGDLTQSGALDVDGAASLTATNADITLENAGNDFASVSASAVDVRLRDANSLIGGAINAENLNITAGSDLTQTGAFVVTDTANIEADSATLTQANNFNSLSLRGDSAQVNDVDGVILGQSDLTTSLSLTAAGDISQSGALSVPVLSIDAGAGNVTLEHTGNQLDSLSAMGGQVSIRDQGALELQAANAANLKVVVDAGITQQVGTVLTVTDELSLSANSIALDNANQINSVELLGGGTATLTNAADLELGDIDVSDLTLNVTGSVSNTAASTINVANTFTVTNTGNIDLGSVSGDQVNFGSVMLNSGDVVLHEDSDTLLKSSTVSGLTVSSTGDVKDDGDLSVSGLLTIDASGDIELGTLGASEDTRFGQISLKGANIRLIEEDSIFVNRAEGDSVELISESGGIKTNGTQIVAQSLLRLDTGPNQNIGDPGNLVDFTLDTSGSLIIDARSAYLTQSAADFSRQVALFSSNALIRSEANLAALTRSEIQFLSYLLGLDDALFNEFVTIFDVADEGMLLPEDQREDQLSWFSDDGRYLVSVDRNARFEYYHAQWAKYGIVFSLTAMNTQPATMEWM
ncbi:MAG: filamentous hemagglutinin N-terminal domain-containing protein [Amphritea sp.]|nr:filamentous hemagglutinin N-terminal domain-containing protein [Amphritea sp.]